MATDRTFEDAVHTTLHVWPTPLSSNFGSPKGPAPDLERAGSRLGTMEKINGIYLQLPLFLQNASRIEIVSRRFHKQWPLKLLRLRVLNKLIAASQPALPLWNLVQPLPQAVLARQDLGTYLDRLTAPLPQGAWAQDLRMKTGIPDADLILSLIQMMKMLEAPSCYSFHMNNPMQGYLFGSGSSGRRPTCHLSTDSSGFIVKEAPNPQESYLKREPSAKTLWRDTRMMVFFMRVRVPFAISAQSWCVNPNRHRTEKLGDVLHHCGQFWFQNYKKS